MSKLAAFVFPGFQTLDYFGPVEMLGDPAYGMDLVTVAKERDPVPSRHGQRILPDACFAENAAYDFLLIPGGDAALEQGKDPDTLAWLTEAARNAECVLAVCTGTILLAMTGLLDGRRATTNKLDFKDTVPLAPKVNWVKEARWVEDGKYFTSSGVSAGIDAALGTLARLRGKEMAAQTAYGSEYVWNADPNNDPFARQAGLLA